MPRLLETDLGDWRRGFEFRYVQILIRFLNKYFSFISFFLSFLTLSKCIFYVSYLRTFDWVNRFLCFFLLEIWCLPCTKLMKQYNKLITISPIDKFYYLAYIGSRGAAARGVTAKPTGCGFDPHSRRWNIYLNLYFHFFALV